MLKLIKNKKGFIASSVVLLVCFVTFIIVGFIFYILFSFAGKLSVYDIGSDSGYIATNYGLLNFLKTPIDINGNKMNMGDLITLYYTEKDENKKEEYRDKIQTITKSQLDKLEYTYTTKEYSIKTIRGFMIFLTDDPKETFGGTAVKKDRKFMSENAKENLPKEVVHQALPLQNGNNMYVLWIETGKRIS